MAIHGLYIHIPFCAKRCHYCDFNTYEGMLDTAPAYVEALKRDLALSVAAGARAVDGGLESVFFGGGTPSLLEPEQVAGLLEAARQGLGLAEDAEVTLEANPGTADLPKFKAYRTAGVNRLSFGFQAAQDAHLGRLGRIHDARQSEEAWELARQAGFDNLSLDLMFGLPGQSAEEWQASLDWALAFRPEHVSFYGLTLEPGTRFHHLHAAGRLGVPGEDAQAAMYEDGIAALERAGLQQYEISNFARTGRASRHNRLYWRNFDTLGLGAGAWSYVDGERCGRERNPARYVEELGAGRIPKREVERLEGRQARAEAAFLGLRMREGIALEPWSLRHGVDLFKEFGAALKRPLEAGLLELEAGALKLTRRGLPLSNEVFSALL